MQTHFSQQQLADSGVAISEQILRKCVHCGFCTATCPTYLLLGDELDSPRGRIYLIKDMLENQRAPDSKTVGHIDRCLSCLSCMTTCPSGVHYMHLVDHARAHIEHSYTRPLADRLLRKLLSVVLPSPGLFRLSLIGAMIGKPFKALMPERLKSMLEMAPSSLAKPSPYDKPQAIPAQGKSKMRVALLTGCAQKVLDPQINEATIRLLTRHGVEVVVADGTGCCGALTHHMGDEKASHGSAAANIRAWMREKRKHGLDHIVINTSGCGTTVKDYGHMLRDDHELAEDAATISAMACDISELLAKLELQFTGEMPRLKLAYHSACSLQHGQKVTAQPPALLQQAGFEVMPVPEGHICCGSAGTYNLLQPDLAGRLLARKIGNINSLTPDLIAAGNIGCMMQIGKAADVPVLHTVQLLDWATGGERPATIPEPSLKM